MKGSLVLWLVQIEKILFWVSLNCQVSFCFITNLFCILIFQVQQDSEISFSFSIQVYGFRHFLWKMWKSWKSRGAYMKLNCKLKLTRNSSGFNTTDRTQPQTRNRTWIKDRYSSGKISLKPQIKLGILQSKDLRIHNSSELLW